MRAIIVLLCINFASCSENEIELKFKRDTIANYLIKNHKAKISDYGYMMEEFFDSHNLWEQEIIKRENFRRILKNFDKKMKDGVINRLHPYAVEFFLYNQRIQKRDNLYTAIKTGRNVKITQLVSYIQPFIQAFDIKPHHGENYDSFYSICIDKDDQITPAEAEKIHPYIKYYYTYIKDITIRNNLLLHINSNPNLPLSSMESLIKAFVEQYGLLSKDTLSEVSFNTLVKRKDFKIDDKNLGLLRTYVNRYKDYLNKVDAREKLISFIEDSPKAQMTEISAVMDYFIYTYKIGDINSQSEFAQHVTYVDFTFTELYIKTVYPYYYDYKIYKKRVLTRDLLLNAIRTPEYDAENKKELFDQFTELYHTIDADVFDFESLKISLVKYDDLMTDQSVKTLQPEIMEYNIKIFKTIVQKNIMNYLTKNKSPTFISISSYMVQLIGAYNLYDSTLKDEEAIKERLKQTEEAYDPEQIDALYDQLLLYDTFDQSLSTLEALEKLIDLRPKASYDMLEKFVQKFVAAYVTKTEDLDSFDDFVKIENLIKVANIVRLKKVYKRVKLYDKYTKRAEIIAAINSIPTDQTKESSKIIVKNLEDLVDVFQIGQIDVEVKEILESRLSRFEKPEIFKERGVVVSIGLPVRIEITEKSHNLIQNYVRSNANRWRQRKLLCEEDTSFCGVEKPQGGSELRWFNFFKFFGGLPHEVEENSLDKLNWFKRTFNKIYKYFTGLDYYITTFDPFTILNIEKLPDTTTTEATTSTTVSVNTEAEDT